MQLPAFLRYRTKGGRGGQQQQQQQEACKACRDVRQFLQDGKRERFEVEGVANDVRGDIQRQVERIPGVTTCTLHRKQKVLFIKKTDAHYRWGRNFKGRGCLHAWQLKRWKMPDNSQ
jgi:hypothetical protein